jgi:hypothetical protein
MRYIVSLALLLSACTRANPEAIGGNGGNAGGGGGGAAGSGGGGGGGSAGGGGTGGGGDMAMSLPYDMTTTGPPDMTSFEGVFCGNMVCKAPTGECCAGQTTVICQSPAIACAGRPFDCDGPEDCMNGDRCCGSVNGSMCATGTGGGGCSNGDVPLCHTLDECGTGYIACCAAPNGGHLRFCSKQPCP